MILGNKCDMTDRRQVKRDFSPFKNMHNFYLVQCRMVTFLMSLSRLVLVFWPQIRTFLMLWAFMIEKKLSNHH
jgi:hypothetical protein